ncbi:hypothetical protein FQZ97_834470 [compost metagenome]
MPGIFARRRDPGGDHPPVHAGRCGDHGPVRFQREPADPAGHGAGYRSGGGRCHRGGGKRAPPHRGGQVSGAGRAHRRAGGGRAGHRHDDHAGRGLRAHRPDGRPHRFALQGIRLHAGGSRGGLGRHRADPVARDELLPAGQPRFRGLDGASGRAFLRAPGRSLRPTAGRIAAPSLGYGPGGRGGAGQPAVPVQRRPARTGAGRGSVHRADRGEIAAARQHRLRGEVRQEVGRRNEDAARAERALADQRVRRRVQ